MQKLDTLREYLEYNPNSGEFHWIKSPKNGINIGSLAGTKTGRYKTIHFKEDGMLTGDIVCRMALPLVVIDEQKTYFAIVYPLRLNISIIAADFLTNPGLIIINTLKGLSVIDK